MTIRTCIEYVKREFLIIEEVFVVQPSMLAKYTNLKSRHQKLEDKTASSYNEH